MSAFGDAIGCLSTSLQSVAGTTITYRRLGETPLSITATVGQTVFEQDSQFGILTITARDYIIPLASISDLGEPRRGDKITEGDEEYEVLSLNNSPPFRYSDHGKTILRIHTKQIEAS